MLNIESVDIMFSFFPKFHVTSSSDSLFIVVKCKTSGPNIKQC